MVEVGDLQKVVGLASIGDEYVLLDLGVWLEAVLPEVLPVVILDGATVLNGSPPKHLVAVDRDLMGLEEADSFICPLPITGGERDADTLMDRVGICQGNLRVCG